MSNPLPPIILVDGSSYLFRAFHALPPLTTRQGHPTGAIKGVISMVRSLQKQYADSNIIIVFDAKGRTFRHELYPEYKAHRPPMPEELRVQIEPIHEIIAAMGLPIAIVEGVEADDVIGTLAQQARVNGQSTIISTGDKDMAQLVDATVTLINTMTGTFMDTQGVIEKFGIPPKRIVDYLALTGDKVDNIPGVEKCGPKTAVKWLNEFDSLQGIIDNADKIAGKVGENLRTAIKQLPLSYQLATIRCDVALPCDLANMPHRHSDNERLLELFNRYEFKSWAAALENPILTDHTFQQREAEVSAPTTHVDRDYETILSWDVLDRWLKRLYQFELFSFDLETTGLDYMQADIVGLSFAVEHSKAAYVPLTHRYHGAPAQLDLDTVLAKLKPLLEDHTQYKVGQHLKFDKNILARYGIVLRGIAHDTMLASYVLNSVATRHDMDSLARHYLNVETIRYETVAGKGVKEKTFDQIDIAEAAPYAAEDADITLRLHRKLWPQLREQASLCRVYQDIEMPLLDVLSRIERNGVKVDVAMLAQQSQALKVDMDKAEQAAHNYAGQAFNLGSPKQLQTLLFEQQGLPVLRKTPKGQPSTAEDVLEILAAEGHVLPELILRYRSLSKLKSTYTDKLPQLVDPDTGRVHTSYHQAITATGRLSSTDPNLQNIPVRHPEGRLIRQAFIAETGHKLIAADYSQIELRIMAHLSADPRLLTAFANGGDIHRATAAEVFDVPLEHVDYEQRRRAKAINFGLIYGMSAFGLAKQLGIARQQAQAYVDAYFQRYPAVKAYMEHTRERAREQGYVETVFGRRLYLPDINARHVGRRQHAERTAINAPMQGTAADIIKRAMIALDHTLQAALPTAKIIMQVHDELVLEVPESEVTTAQAIIREAMLSAATLKVPLEVDLGVGNHWDQAH